MVLEYSLRLRRWATTRPGSGLAALSAASMWVCAYLMSAAIWSAGGLGMPLGGISLALSLRMMAAQPSGFSMKDLASRNFSTLKPPEETAALWQPMQVLRNMGVTAWSKVASAAACTGRDKAPNS